MRIFMCLILSIIGFSSSLKAQEVDSYVRVGIGTGASSKCFHSLATEAVGGISYNGLHAAISLTLYNSSPFQNKTQSIYTEMNPAGESFTLHPFSKAMENKRSVSALLEVGYDLLRFIPGNHRHKLIPFVGIGWGGLTKMKSVYHAPVAWSPDGSTDKWATSIVYDASSAFDYCLGGRYEFAITDKWRIGASYKYLDLLEGDLLFIHVSRTF